jgi:hypothetical protein
MAMCPLPGFLERTESSFHGTPFGAAVALACLASSVFGCGTPSNGGSADEPIVSAYDSGSPGDEPPPMSLGTTCFPGEVSSFIPIFKKPVGPYAGDCTPDTLASLATCLTEATTPAAYTACFQHTGALCASCVASEPPNPSGTPFLVPENGALGIVDEGACIALSDPSSSSSFTCALQTEFAFECAWAACVNFCPIPRIGNATNANRALNTCFSAAWSGVCSTYAMKVTACQDELVGGPAAYCRSASRLPATPTLNPKDLLRFLSLACGPSPLDGAVDAGSTATDASLEGDGSVGDASPTDALLGDASAW